MRYLVNTCQNHVAWSHVFQSWVFHYRFFGRPDGQWLSETVCGDESGLRGLLTTMKLLPKINDAHRNDWWWAVLNFYQSRIFLAKLIGMQFAVSLLENVAAVELEKLRPTQDDAIGVYHQSLTSEQRWRLSQGRAEIYLHITKAPASSLRHVCTTHHSNVILV